MRHERHRFATRPRNRRRRKCATPALADLHRSLRLRRGAVMAIWPDPSHGGLRPHLHLLGHWCTLCWRLGALPMAHDFAAVGADALPDGIIADHIRDLARKARTQGAGRLDQTLLLRSVADRLRGSN